MDTRILRSLAYEYNAIAHDEHNRQRVSLHKSVNSLRMIRPVVLIDELPWSEMNTDGELTLHCQDPVLREAELFMRREIYKFKHLRADMIVRPYLPVPKVISSTGDGVNVIENTLATDVDNRIISHEYIDQFADGANLEMLRVPAITYDADETDRRYQLIGSIIGDILPLKKTGIDYMTMHPWDDISRYRSVTPLLVDLAERPEFSHKLARRVFDIGMAEAEQYLKLGLYENDPWNLHCTPILCDELYPNGFTGEHTDFSTIWGRGTAQIFGAVSKDMHEEFDISYQIETIGRCGLVYYGCCEPLDRKIDMVEKIPNLRKVSITPWADVQIAAEAIGKRYVLSSKPNPAAVAVPVLDTVELRREISGILEACAKNGCSCDIVLKDISTCHRNPQNIFMTRITTYSSFMYLPDDQSHIHRREKVVRITYR